MKMAEEMNMLPAIAFSRKRASVLIYQSTVRALGKPRFVRILCNEKRKRLAIQVCAEKESGAIKIPKKRGRGSGLPKLFLLSSLVIQSRIWNLCGWETNENYRVFGIFRQQQELVEFDLTKANAIPDELFLDPECPK